MVFTPYSQSGALSGNYWCFILALMESAASLSQMHIKDHVELLFIIFGTSKLENFFRTPTMVQQFGTKIRKKTAPLKLTTQHVTLSV